MRAFGLNLSIVGAFMVFYAMASAFGADDFQLDFSDGVDVAEALRLGDSIYVVRVEEVGNAVKEEDKRGDEYSLRYNDLRVKQIAEPIRKGDKPEEKEFTVRYFTLPLAKVAEFELPGYAWKRVKPRIGQILVLVHYLENRSAPRLYKTALAFETNGENEDNKKTLAEKRIRAVVQHFQDDKSRWTATAIQKLLADENNGFEFGYLCGLASHLPKIYDDKVITADAHHPLGELLNAVDNCKNISTVFTTLSTIEGHCLMSPRDYKRFARSLLKLALGSNDKGEDFGIRMLQRLSWGPNGWLEVTSKGERQQLFEKASKNRDWTKVNKLSDDEVIAFLKLLQN